MVENLAFKLAFEGFIRGITARGKNDHTIGDYRVTFTKRLLYLLEDTLIFNLAPWRWPIIRVMNRLKFLQHSPSHYLPTKTW